MNKTHAKDYLTEFSKEKSEWLKVLIKEAVETNGNISEARKDEIFSTLLNNSQLQAKIPQTALTQQNSEKLIFEALTHISGVNALCENQTIKFSPDITILYGLNGSGKSSYFRILNNASGGTQQKNIFPNIYVNDANKKPINVSIKYKLGNSSKQHNCNRAIAVQSDFQGTKVFDSSYLNGLLQPKTPDETFIYPLGLHLFRYISQIMDSFVNKLNQLSTQKLQDLPIIKTNDFCNDIKTKFNSHENFDKKERDVIKIKFNFSENEKKDLAKKEEDLKQLQQTNYQDKITLLTKENAAFLDFTTKINNTTKNLKDYSDKFKKAFEVYTAAKTKNDEARKQSEIITKLPNSDTLEWKTFIKAGQKYSSKLEKEDQTKCPYCHQELKSEEAINIIKAYATFLSDTSESELNTAEKEIKDIREELINLDLLINISDEIKTAITDLTNLQNKIQQLSLYKTNLLTAKELADIPTIIPDFSQEFKMLENRQKENDNVLENITSIKEEKDKKITELQNSIAELKEKKSISEQKSDIEKYFSVYDDKNRIEAKKAETRTTELTKLSMLAQNALLTESLKIKFENELKSLGKNNLKVILEVANGNKGKCQTQLRLVGNNSIQDILSEGEQKAVGLAMFFAEIQNENNPIILDDPVTSLDHEIAGNVAKRLLDFNNQVVVLCHNRLFLDGFETSRENHICKTIDSACNNSRGKHIIIYKIEAHNSKKGILSNYKGDNSTSLLNEINSELSKTPFEESMKVSILLRRAVEKIIDECIFRGQLPPKVSNKYSRISWEELEKINPNPQLIKRLKNVHDKTSEEIHDGTASVENPITIDCLKEMLEELESIKSEFKDIIQK